MNLIKPEKLKKGDTIGILATSGASEDNESLLRAQKFFEEHGYNVIFSDNALDEFHGMAGKDEKRLDELHKFFQKPEIKAIICMRGGYGAIRLIKKINYDLIRQNPKIFCGYSDITALCAMFLKNSNLITYHGPMAAGDFGREVPDEFTMNSFFKTLTSNQLTYKADTAKIYNTGSAEGILWGGNLATIVSLCGQNFIPDENFIFFAEDIKEQAYKIDKMMTQLINIDKFTKNIKGMVLGDFLDTDMPARLDELFEEIGKRLNIPVIGGLKITHATQKLTLPYGGYAKISDKCLHIEY